MPCELKASSMNWCGTSKVICGKLALPRPSWFVTMAILNPAARAPRSASKTPGMKRIFSTESTCSSGGSSISVPSRSTKSTLAALTRGSG